MLRGGYKMDKVNTDFLAIIFRDTLSSEYEILFYEKGTPTGQVYKDLIEYKYPIFNESLNFTKTLVNNITRLNRGFAHEYNNGSGVSVVTSELELLSLIYYISLYDFDTSVNLAIKMQNIAANTGKVYLNKLDSFEKYITKILIQSKYVHFLKSTTPEIPLDTYNLREFTYKLANITGSVFYFIGTSVDKSKHIKVAFDSVNSSLKVIVGTSADIYRSYLTLPESIDYQIQSRLITMYRDTDKERRWVL